MSEPTEPPPTLSYRSRGAREEGPGAGVDRADVAVGFLSMGVVVPLGTLAFLAGAQGDLLSWVVGVAAVGIVGGGFVGGVSRGRWEFLAGAGLCAGLVVTLGAVWWWVTQQA